ncbi:unnamed protein product [Ilex paraguariensis]|uniref:Uncharacterized protein n=1 Tax=Ilex paraguariensis TaxID=185542 RepID=A0ABC8SDQ3_9AQUA
MEANKEGREQQQQERKAADSDGKTTSLVDPMTKAREVLREAIITETGEGGDNSGAEKEEAAKKHPDQFLVFSRAVHNVDSSLE